MDKDTWVNWGSGNVEFWDLDDLDSGSPLFAQLGCLKEDLAQVSYRGRLVIDIGWHPEFSVAGSFMITVVEDGDWDSPVLLLTARNFEELQVACQAAVSTVESMSLQRRSLAWSSAQKQEKQ